jgi:hypothetical protein
LGARAQEWIIRLPWRGQCGRAAAGWACAAAALRCSCSGQVRCIHWLCLSAGRPALLLSDLVAFSAFRTAVTLTLVSLDKCNLWLRIDVCVGIIAFLILCLHPRCWGSILRRAKICNGVAVCLVFLDENLVDFPFFVYVAVNVTAGVSGFEGREVFFEVIWHCNIQTAWVVSPGHSGTPYHCFRDEVSHLDRYTLSRCTYIL